jgi:ABC-type sugar transport system ATPase subunit
MSAPIQTDAPKLQITNLHKEYDDGAVIAVDGIDLTVERGETVALLGPSGCGKSTTLNMIVGLEEPTAGNILIDGKSIIGVPSGQRNVGLVFQDYAVFTHMTVAKNLSFGLEVNGVPKAEITRRVGEVVELLGLQDLLSEKASALGGSQLQRVAIGRTLVTQPAILLLDEPLSNLEAEARQTMRRELRRLQGETGLTIVYVTHDQTEALSLAHRIAVMSHGKIRQYDQTNTVYHNPSHVFVAGFMGSPAMNLIRGDIVRSGRNVRIAREGFGVTLPAHLAAQAPTDTPQAVLGIRPETITLTKPGKKTGAKSLLGDVVLVAPRGPEAVVTVETQGVEITALVAMDDCPHEGDAVELVLPPEALVLFSGETGRNLDAAVGMEVAA